MRKTTASPSTATQQLQPIRGERHHLSNTNVQKETAMSYLKACRTGTVTEISNHLNNLHRPDTARGKGDETALHIAITHNPEPFEVTKLLLYHGHNANVRGYRTEAKTPLHQAAWRGCAETVRELLKYGARVDAVKRGDWTPLMIACAKGSLDVVNVLLTAGADVNTTNRIGESCLHVSARVSVHCLRACISAGANVNQRTGNGKTALHYAARVGMIDCVRLLLSAGCEMASVDKAGMTCAHEAALSGHDNVLDSLKNIWWEVDCAGWNCLHHAAREGHQQVVEMLLKDGKDYIDVSDQRGFTPLRLAICNGHVPVVDCLVRARARLERSWIEEDTRSASKNGNVMDVYKNLDLLPYLD